MDIDDVIHYELINLSLQCATKKDALYQLAKILYDGNIINKISSFIDDVEYRESIGDTYIGLQVALPHGQSHSVKKVSVVITKLTNPIIWDSTENHQVKYIILIALPQKYDLLVCQNTLSPIIDLFTQIDFLKTLDTITQSQEVISFIKMNLNTSLYVNM